MTRDKALDVARISANQRGESMICVQVKNGQWLVERHEFVRNDPRGRMMYSNRQQITVLPDALVSEKDFNLAEAEED